MDHMNQSSQKEGDQSHGDDDRLTMIIPPKRQISQQKDDDDQKEKKEDDEEGEEEEEDEQEKDFEGEEEQQEGEKDFMKRWLGSDGDGDRAAMLTLLRHHSNVATYNWDMSKMDIREPTMADIRCGGDGVIYDIVFVQGEDIFGSSISRTVPPGGTLSFFHKRRRRHQEQEEEDGTSTGGGINSGTTTSREMILCGKIENVIRTSSDNDFGWEVLAQIHDMEFRETPRPDDWLPQFANENNRRAHQERRRQQQQQQQQLAAAGERQQQQQLLFTTTFDVTKINGITPGPTCNKVATVSGVLHNSGSVPWSPVEKDPSDSDKAYIEFMQAKLVPQENNHPHPHSFWKQDASWLCQHLGLPVETARHIHSYNWHELPPPYWLWEASDIILYVTDAHGSSTWLVARPRPRLGDGQNSNSDYNKEDSTVKQTDEGEGAVVVMEQEESEVATTVPL